MIQTKSQPFGRMFRSLRKRAGYSNLEHLADAVNGEISIDDLRTYERSRVPTEEKARVLADAFKLTTEEREAFFRECAVARAPRRPGNRAQLERLLERLGETIAQPDSSDDSRLLGLFKSDVSRIAQLALGTPSAAPEPRLEILQADSTHISFRNAGATELHDGIVVFPGPAFKNLRHSLNLGDTIEVPLGLDAIGYEPILAEFRDVEASLYLQAFDYTDEAGRLLVALSERCVARAQCWFDINRFIVHTLLREPFRFAIRNTMFRVLPNWALNSVCDRLKTSEQYRAHGFEIDTAPDRVRDKDFPELALMSKHLNRRLWREPIGASEDRPCLQRLDNSLIEEGNALRALLEAKYVSVIATDQRFSNENKLCAGSDILSPGIPVSIFQGTYYHGFVTNEFVRNRLEQSEGRDFHHGFLSRAFAQVGDGYEIRGITNSMLSNHVGASALLVTSDGWIVLWRQSRGEHSVGMIQTTGSGSCDWRTDWFLLPEPKTLTAAAIAAMERELREESGLTGRALSQKPLDTRLLAYFRWIRRGGKPEFVGISRANISVSELMPDTTEVDLPASSRDYLINARTPEALLQSIGRVLRGNDIPRCSLPLWVGLTALEERCRGRDAELREFLWG